MVDKEQCVKVFIRCQQDQLELMDQFFLSKTRSYENFKKAINGFYKVMFEVNSRLKKSGEEALKITYIHDKTGHA